MVGEQLLQSEGAGVVRVCGRAPEDEDETGRWWRRGGCGRGSLGRTEIRMATWRFRDKITP